MAGSGKVTMPALPGGRGRSRVAGACVTGRRLGDVKAVKLGKVDDRPVKLVELDAHPRRPRGLRRRRAGRSRLPRPAAARSRLAARRGARTASQAVIQLHRLREVLALAGFTRFEAVTPDIDGEYETDVRARAARAGADVVPRGREPRRGAVRPAATAKRCRSWLDAAGGQAAARRTSLAGHERWIEGPQAQAPVPRRAVRAAAHALAPAAPVARRCAAAIPASSIRERIYADVEAAALRHPALHRQPGRRGHARRAGPGGAPHRAAPRARAAHGRALLERPHLRPARARAEHGGALAARRRLPRLRAGRRDVLRDAQRLPRPRAGGARCSACPTRPSSRPSG